METATHMKAKNQSIWHDVRYGHSVSAEATMYGQPFDA